MEYGIQTYDQAGNIIFSTRKGVSNAVILGYVDVTQPEGEFHVENIPHDRSLFYFQTPTIMPDNPAPIASPCIQFYPTYNRDKDAQKVSGFAWQYWGYHPHDNGAAPERVAVRIYYGFY